MRLACFEHRGRTGLAAVVADEIVDLTGIDGGWTLRDAITGCRNPVLPREARKIPVDKVRLLPPLISEGRNFWVGANYRTLRNIHDGTTPGGNHPSLFQRTAQSLVGHGGSIERPRTSRQLDYEGEIVIVIGKGGRHIAEADALDHIAGLTIANDGSVRDYMDHGRNVTAGKNFDASGAIGPWIVTCDELDPRRDLTIETRVNGELRQSDNTANLRFSFAQLIAYISSFTCLLPGDMIATGSPQGAGGGPFGATPPRWLEPGDLIEIQVTGIGTLRNHVVVEGALPGGGDADSVEVRIEGERGS